MGAKHDGHAWLATTDLYTVLLPDTSAHLSTRKIGGPRGVRHFRGRTESNKDGVLRWSGRRDGQDVTSGERATASLSKFQAHMSLPDLSGHAAGSRVQPHARGIPFRNDSDPEPKPTPHDHYCLFPPHTPQIESEPRPMEEANIAFNARFNPLGMPVMRARATPRKSSEESLKHDRRMPGHGAH